MTTVRGAGRTPGVSLKDGLEAPSKAELSQTHTHFHPSRRPLAMESQRGAPPGHPNQGRRGDRPVGPLAQLGVALPHPAVRGAGPQDPPSPGPDRSGPTLGQLQRAGRVDQHQDPGAHPDGVRVPLPRGPHRHGHAGGRRRLPRASRPGYPGATRAQRRLNGQRATANGQRPTAEGMPPEQGERRRRRGCWASPRVAGRHPLRHHDGFVQPPRGLKGRCGTPLRLRLRSVSSLGATPPPLTPLAIEPRARTSPSSWTPLRSVHTEASSVQLDPQQPVSRPAPPNRPTETSEDPENAAATAKPNAELMVRPITARLGRPTCRLEGSEPRRGAALARRGVRHGHVLRGVVPPM